MVADNKFIEEHQALVHGIARKVLKQFDLNVEVDDLVAFGMTGLLEAEQRFDASRGVRFQTFAYYRVRGAIVDGVRKMAFLPRRIHDRLKAAAAADEITESAGEARAAIPPGQRDTAQSVQAVDSTLGRLAASYVISALGQDEDDGDTKRSPEEAFLDRESAQRLRALLPTLPERELALVQGYYFEGRQFNEVAKELGISKAWASRLHQKALDRLKESLEAG